MAKKSQTLKDFNLINYYFKTEHSLNHSLHLRGSKWDTLTIVLYYQIKVLNTNNVKPEKVFSLISRKEIYILLLLLNKGRTGEWIAFWFKTKNRIHSHECNQKAARGQTKEQTVYNSRNLSFDTLSLSSTIIKPGDLMNQTQTKHHV